MKTSSVLVVCAAMLFGLVAIRVNGNAAENPPAKKDPPKPPELTVLDQFVGTWNTEVTYNPAVATARQERVTGKITSKWVLGGRFVQEEGRSLGSDRDHMVLWSYDPQKKAYRSWFYDSVGSANESQGQWDEKSKTLSWKADLGDGMTYVSRHHFIDKDTYEWDYVVTDKDGKVYMDVHGKHTRRN
jgi:hypothetical protein